MVEVCAAIIQREGKQLLCQRARGKRQELLWEFPGGKIEPDETPEECLVRECKEELDIEIELKQLVDSVVHAYPDMVVSIGFYLCELVSGEPTCIEHEAIAWFSPGEIRYLPLCPADKKMMENHNWEMPVK